MPARPPARRAPAPSSGARGGRPPRPADTGARREAVQNLLAPVVAGLGLELEDVELRSVGRRVVLRVLVDSATGVSLDDVATASHAVSEALDAAEPLGDEPYTLEVSSPGIDRPLILPRHWRRNVGRLVAVTLVDGREVTGRVLEAGDDEVELELDVKGRKSRRTLALADVRRALVQVEFSRVAAAELDDLGDEGDDGTDVTDTDDDGTDDTDDTDDETEG
ncbi:MAG: ribosome maturation factor RimP [Candidatus Nanopelagicales bacterium]